MSLQKILSIVVAIIGIVGAILWVMIAKAEVEGEGPIGLMLNVGKGLVIVAGLLAFIFSLINIVTDGQKLKKTLTSLVVFLILAGISYGLAEGVAVNEGDVNITESGSHWVGTGLYLFYLLAAVAFGTMLVFGVKKTFVK